MNERIRVLLIEDDPEYALLIRLYVNEAGGETIKYALECANSLAAGLDRLLRQEFDIVLLDLMLTDSEGLDTLARFRRRAPGIPVVILTNLDPAATDLKALSEGAQDFLLKSELNARQLQRAIRYALERSRMFGQMEALVRASPDGVVILDHAGRVRYANPAAFSLFNRTADQIQGRPFEHPLPADAPSEVSLTGPDGKRSVEMRAAPIEWKGVKARLVTIRDITELKRLEQVRAEVKERRQMDQLKDKLLSTVSHEMRTPLTIIKVAVSTTCSGLAGPLTHDQEKLLRSADRNITRLTRILNNFLDLSRLESGRAHVDRQSVDLGQLVREIADDLRTLYKNKNVSLFVNYAPELPPVFADRDMLAQAISNLLDNALRYARSRVQVRVKRVGEEIVLSTLDDGLGLPDGGKADLFNKFVQLDRPKGGDGYKGTGLGLAICREIMSLNGGRIWAENVPKWGAGFHFALPAVVPAPASAEGGSPGKNRR